MAIVWLVISLILFIGLVVVHEWGHFVTARRGGVEVEEFGIFFPPRLYKKKMPAGWTFSINLLPLGGFVKLKGEHDSDTEPGSFGAASTWTKTKIMVAGVFMNLIVALALLTILALVGLPKLIPNQFTVPSDTHLVAAHVLVGDVQSGSPAQKAGLKAEDEITDISLPGYSPVAITDAITLPNITKNFAGRRVNVDYIRSGQDRTTQITLLSAKAVAASQNSSQPKGYLGISPVQYTLNRYTWSAPIEAVGLSAQVTALTFAGLGHALGGLGTWIAGIVTHNATDRHNGSTNATAQVGGPVAIFFILKDGSLLGAPFVLFIIAIISLTLAIMNILPIPALDGGRLWLMLVSRLFKKQLSPQREEAINGAGFVILFSLLILITIVDVHRFL